MPTKKIIKKSVKKKTTPVSETKPVSFVDAVRSYWNGYFNFNGVSNRALYWWAVLFVVLVNLVFHYINIGWLSLIVSAILFFPSRAVAFRRYHDVGMSGWWNLAPVLIFTIWTAVRSSTWSFMLNLEYMPVDLAICTLMFLVWVIFNFIVVVQPSKIQNNKYRK